MIRFLVDGVHNSMHFSTFKNGHTQDALHCNTRVEVIVMEFWIVQRLILDVRNVDEIARVCHMAYHTLVDAPVKGRRQVGGLVR
eukprot:Skav208882  [mRNA]  locus=scaffold270:205066:206747:+ [translate_table: standard]